MIIQQINPTNSVPDVNTLDIDEIQKAYSALNNSHKILTEILQQSPVGILVWKIECGTILKTNFEFERLVGIENCEGRNYFDLYGSKNGWSCYYPDNTFFHFENLPPYKFSTLNHTFKNVELLLQRPHAAELWVLVSTVTIHDDKGAPTAVAILVHDINEHKKAENKIHENEERLHYALTASDEGLWDYDFLKSVGYLSPRYYEMLGYEDGDFPASSEQWATMLHPDDKEESVRAFKNVGNNKTGSYMATYRLRTKSGKYCWILSRGIVVRNHPDSGSYRLVGTHLDITVQKEMEEALRTANKKLKARIRNRTEELNKTLSVNKRVKEELTELNLLEIKSQDFIAKSPEMSKLLMTAIKLAKLEVSNILITGGSGTGKSKLAKFIHHTNDGKAKTFVQLNCAALPENLLEAEIFGYEKGAFTGARDEGKIGLFELAQGGTLFLDEIGEMPITIQAKLLKYLDDKEITRLGGLTPIKVNCMVITATNANLPKLIKQKKFRQDLFFRLSTFPVHIPPLRERQEDLFELTNYFINQFNKQYSLNRRLSPVGYKALQKHPFPGNVRELRNLINKVTVLSENNLLDDSIMQEIQSTQNTSSNEDVPLESKNEGFEKQVKAFEINLLKNAMKKHKSTRNLASHLKMSQSAVVRRLRKYNL